MGRIMRSMPPGPVMIIGADVPGIRPGHIGEGFRALDQDAVFGPATDGGYWMIGLRRTRIPATLFQHVQWSTEHALHDTKRSLGSDARIREVATLRDVDTLADLKALAGRS